MVARNIDERMRNALLLGRWKIFQKANRRWMLLVMAVGLFLCWDAATSQGCSKGANCGGLFSKQFTKAVLRDGQGSKAHNDGVLIFGHEDSLRTRSGEVVVQTAVNFSDSVLLVLNPLVPIEKVPTARLPCMFSGSVQTNALSAEDGFIRCAQPPSLSRKALYGSRVTFQLDGEVQISDAIYGSIGWKKIVYGLVLLEHEGDALLFVKGLTHNKKGTLPEGLKCQYGDGIMTEVVAFCQENVRCKLPPSHNRSELLGKLVTVFFNKNVFPSVVRFYPHKFSAIIESLGPAKTRVTEKGLLHWKLLEVQKPFQLCVCTMVWNGAKFLREWVIYHSHLGVQKFFLYDNNSDDDILSVIRSLESYNVSRHFWPWLKTQEAGFSHCAIRASSECAWVAFIDLDEFIFPKRFLKRNITLEPPLQAMIRQYDPDDLGRVGQLKIPNFNFGPSGLKVLPKSGQIVNYICRMSAPKRVKSVVRISAISMSYCSRVHHFELKRGFKSVQLFQKDVIIHHYKYQVWEDFRMKFVRRAATFVTDWQQQKDLASFDRTPGLGTEAIQPTDWAHKFCEIEDTALRDFVLSVPQLQFAGQLLWE